ncbi:MAG: ice-binding family protein [Candidatus Saccharimonadales bacterium]
MKHFNRISSFAKGTIVLSFVLSLFVGASVVQAATSPLLGAADSFVILSDSYVNTTGGTTLTGDLGYTSGPAMQPTVNGNTHVADSTYNQAGIDQGVALSALASQPCTFNFAPGPIDLASDTTHGPVGVYTPGVYCITGAASIGGGGTITLDGAGTYIFRMDGALTTSANSQVVLSNGATVCDVWWTPTQASTLGANSTFRGTIIAAPGITSGNNVTWTGKALAFGGTVSTSSDTISTSTCAPIASGPSTPTPPTTSVPLLAETGVNTLLLIAIVSAVSALGAVILLRAYLKTRTNS